MSCCLLNQTSWQASVARRWRDISLSRKCSVAQEFQLRSYASFFLRKQFFFVSYLLIYAWCQKREAFPLRTLKNENAHYIEKRSRSVELISRLKKYKSSVTHTRTDFKTWLLIYRYGFLWPFIKMPDKRTTYT